MNPCATRSSLLPALLIVSAFALASTPANATNPYYNHWKAKYPDSKTDDNVIAGTGVGCQMCHVNPGGHSPWNAYGWQIRQEIIAGHNIDEALALAEPFDSDNDPTGSTNLEEILADAQPGWTYGPNNSFFFDTGAVQSGKLPPAGIQGHLDTVWTKFDGTGLAGTNGLPNLKGVGSLTAGMPLSLNLGKALGGAPAMLIIGLSQIDVPLKGGVLVPAADVLVPLVTDGGGSLAVPGVWPAGVPPGFDFWVQFWIDDPAAPAGFAASNGVQGTAN